MWMAERGVLWPLISGGGDLDATVPFEILCTKPTSMYRFAGGDDLGGEMRGKRDVQQKGLG